MQQQLTNEKIIEIIEIIDNDRKELMKSIVNNGDVICYGTHSKQVDELETIIKGLIQYSRHIDK